jgi:hypothetical protein
MFEMFKYAFFKSDLEFLVMSQQEQLKNLQTLHIKTSMLMAKFIDGYYCPKTAHLIVSELGQLISYAQSLQIKTNLNMYYQMLEHWQMVTNQLLEKQKIQTYH